MILYENGDIYLEHHQIKGAKHGIRRWQYEDGSLTPEGRIHYGVGPPRGSKEGEQNNPKSTNISIGKDRTGLIDVNIKGKNLDLSDFRKALTNLKTQTTKINNERKAKAVEKERIKAEEKEKAAKAAEGKRLAEEKLKQEEELARQRSEVDALKEYYVSHPLKIYEARNVLSKEDIKDVEDKILFERELKDFRRDELLRYARTAKDVGAAIGDVYKGLDNLKNLYNLGADTYNAFVAAKDPNDDKRPMRKIGDGHNMKDTSQKKKQNNQNGDQKQPQEQSKQKDQKQPQEQPKQKDQNKETSQQNKKQDASQKSTDSKQTKHEYVEKIDDRYFYSQDELKAYKENKAQSSSAKTVKPVKLTDEERSDIANFAKKFYDTYSNASENERDRFRVAFNAKVRSLNTEYRTPVEQQMLYTVYDTINTIEKKK